MCKNFTYSYFYRKYDQSISHEKRLYEEHLFSNIIFIKFAKSNWGLTLSPYILGEEKIFKGLFDFLTKQNFLLYTTK